MGESFNLRQVPEHPLPTGYRILFWKKCAGAMSMTQVDFLRRATGAWKLCPSLCQICSICAQKWVWHTFFGQEKSVLLYPVQWVKGALSSWYAQPSLIQHIINYFPFTTYHTTVGWPRLPQTQRKGDPNLNESYSSAIRGSLLMNVILNDVVDERQLPF